MRQMVIFLVKREIYEMRLFVCYAKIEHCFKAPPVKKFQNGDIRSWLMLGNHLIFSKNSNL